MIASLKKRINRSRNESGIALIISMIVMMAIAIISAAVIFQAITQYRISRRHKAETVSMNLAESGVEYAIWKLNLNSTFTGTGPISVGEGTYQCTISILSSTERLISSTGSAAGYPALRTILVKVALGTGGESNWQGNSPFGYAAFGSDKVTDMSYVGSTRFDAYNSDSGCYATTTLECTNMGDVRSNAGISLGGSAVIYGDARCGPDDTVTGGSAVKGEIQQSETYANLVSLPTDSVNTASLGPAITLNGSDELILGTPGNTTTYYYKSITITGNAKIKIAVGAVVKIYCSGDMNVGGNGIMNNNPGQDATTLQIFCNGTSASLGGSAGFCGVVYAPRATIAINGGQPYYGSFIGNKVNAVGSPIVHYDMATMNINVPWWSTPAPGSTQGVNTIISWQRR